MSMLRKVNPKSASRLLLPGCAILGLSLAYNQISFGEKSLVETSMLPTDAKPGQCYAKVLVPAQYTTQTKSVLIQEAGESIQIIPARYQTSEIKVAVQSEATELVPVPATYKTVEEKIEIEPAKSVWRMGSAPRAAIADPKLVTAAMALGLPKQAELGACYTEVFTPPKYETQAKKVLIAAASFELQVSESKYEWIEEKVLVREASEQLVEIPAVYETVTERVLQSPAQSTWKRGRGLTERVDNATGEIMCLVETPAQYKTIEKKILKSPASVKTVQTPAEYKLVKTKQLVQAAEQVRKELPAKYQQITRSVLVQEPSLRWQPISSKQHGQPGSPTLCYSQVAAKYATISKQVVERPATINKVTIPAKYQRVAVQKLVSNADQKRIALPEEYAQIPHKVLAKPEQLEWRSVLCDTNTTPELVQQIQQSLHRLGLDPGEIDGKLGRKTMAAIDIYQQRKDIARGGLTLATLASLGIDLPY